MGSASRHLRAWVYLLVPPIALVAATWIALAGVHWMARETSVVGALYNQLYLWLLTKYHERELLFVWIPLALGLFWAPICFRKPLRSWPTRILAIVGALTLIWSAAVVFGENALWPVSRWPFLAGILLVPAIHSWARLAWPYITPLYRVYRWLVSNFLEDDPRAASYMTLLEGVSDQSLKAPPTRRFVPESANPSRGTSRIVRWLVLLLRSGWGSLQPLRGVLRFLVPRYAMQPLADNDGLLFREIGRLRAESAVELERALYGPESGSPDELSEKRQALVRRYFNRWLALTDALAECHSFKLLGNGVLDEQQKAHLRTAAELHADAARFLLRPCFRSVGPYRFTWWRPLRTDDDGAVRAANERANTVALEFVEKELLCLSRLDGPMPDSNAGTTTASMLHLIRQKKLRLLFAHLGRFGLREILGDAPPDDLGLARVWTEATRVLPPFADDPEIAACRARYFDAALFCRAPRPVDVCRAIPLASAQDLDEQQESEQWVLGFAFWKRAQQAGAGDVVGQLLRSAVQALASSRHASIRTFAEVVPERDRAIIAPALAVAVNSARWQDAPRLPALGWQDIVPQGSGWWPPAEANTFLRLCFIVLSVALAVPTFFAFALNGVGAVVEAPDLRLGSSRLTHPVSMIAPGKEEDASVWLATEGGGVHVKAGSYDHHWYNLTKSNTGLLSDYVVRLNVGQRRVVYLCTDGEQRNKHGICLSSSPRAPVGRWPWLGVGDWWTLLDLSAFGNVSDQAVTAVGQAGDSRLLLIGTRGKGLGRYLPSERRWLDQVTIDDVNGFLPREYNTITSLATIEDRDGWQVWLGTENGIAGGPVLPANLSSEAWRVVVGDRLVGRTVKRVATRSDESLTLVDYMTASQGIGRIAPSSAGTKGGDVKADVVIGATSVTGLDQLSLRDVLYQHDTKRLWTLSSIGKDGASRVSLYRETSHSWSTQRETEAAPVTFDFAEDMGRANQILVGSRNALLIVSDRGNPELHTSTVGFPGFDLRQVVAAPKETGIGVFAIERGDSRPSFHHLARGFDEEAKADASSEQEAGRRVVIGSERMLGLRLDRVRIVEPGPPDGGLFIGTSNLGLGYIDTAKRQVRPLTPNDTTEVRDLAFVQEEASDARLYRATRGRLDFTVWPELKDWTPIVGTTSGSINPNDVASIAAIGAELILGTPNAVSLYNMNDHRWSDLPAPPGSLRELLALGESLWAITGEDDSKALHTLHRTKGKPTKWSDEFSNIRAYDAEGTTLATVSALGGIETWHAGVKKKLVASSSLSPWDAPPRAAAVSDSSIYLTSKRGDIRRYDLHNRGADAWDNIERPKAAADVSRLHLNDIGLWLLDESDALFLSRSATSKEWEKNPVATDVVESDVFWGDRSVVVRTASGKVIELSSDARVIVGDGFRAPEFSSDLEQVVEFDGRLYFVVGDRLATYDPETHSWTEHQVGQGTKFLATTPAFLYALDRQGSLFRREIGRDETWHDLASLTDGNRVESVVEIGDAIALRIQRPLPGGIDVALIRDAHADALQMLHTETAGPISVASISSAAELGSDLFLGTKENTVWSYTNGGAGGDPVNSPHWLRVSNLPGSGAVRDILTNGRDEEVVVVAEDGVGLVKRTSTGWRVVKQVEFQTNSSTHLIGAAFSPDSIAVATAESESTVVRELADDKEWIGEGDPHRGETRVMIEDPVSQDLFRLDDQGELSRYRKARRAWEPQELPKLAKLFVNSGQVWAWSRQGGKLYREARDTWQPVTTDGAVLDVAEDSRAILIRTENGVFLREGDADFDSLVPSSADVLTSITAAAEIDDWLLLGGGDGLSAYHGATHSWKRVPTGGSVRSIVKSPAGTPGISVVTDSGELYTVRVVPEGLDTSKATLPNMSHVRRLLEADGKQYLLNDSSGLFRSDQKAGWSTLLAPAPLRLGDRIGQIRALADHDGKLFFSISQVSGEYLVSYDPDRMVWLAEAIGPGYISRFLKTSSGEGTERLFAERIAGDEPTQKALVEIVDGNEDRWTQRTIVDQCRDLTTDGTSFWFVDANGTIQNRNSHGDTTNALPEEMGAPDDITAAVPHGDQLLVLATDGRIWSYSLSALRWKQALPEQQFSFLVELEGSIFAVAGGGAEMFRFTGGEGNAAWEKVSKDPDSGVVRLSSENRKVAPLWRVSKTDGALLLEWRENEDSPWNTVGAKANRLDFNRFSQVEFRGGVLIAESAAHLGTRAIHRRFSTTEGGLQEQLVADRFARVALQGSSELAEPSSLVVDGGRFEIEADQDGAWTGNDHDGHGTLERFSLALQPETVGASKIGLVPIPIGSDSVAMSIDYFEDFAIDGDILVAKTRNGLLVAQGPDGSGKIRRIGFEPTQGVFRGLYVSQHGVAAGFSQTAQPSLRLLEKGSWKAVRDSATREAFETGTGIRRYNTFLKNWSVDKVGGEVQFQVHLPGGESVPVSLDATGFGFDRIAAIQLTEDRIVFVTTDGHVEYERGNPLGRPLSIAPDDVPPTREHNAGLTGPALDDERFTWRGDEEVKLLLESMNENLVGRFDRQSGQFSFDRVRAIQGFGQGVWVVTDAGVQTWKDGKIRAVALQGVPPFGGTVSAASFHRVDRQWLLSAAGEDGAVQTFAFDGETWKLQGPTAGLLARLAEQRQFFLQGDRWRVRRGDTAGRADPRFQFMNCDGAWLARSLDRNGVWRSDHVNTVVGDSDRVVLGTHAGVAVIDVNQGTRCFGDVGGAVTRVAIESRAPNGQETTQYHVEVTSKTGSREMVLSRDLRETGLPKQVFSERDRLLLATSDWTIRRRPVRIKRRPARDQPFEEVHFNGSRFDFDSVLDTGVTDGGFILATETGILFRSSARPAEYNRDPTLPSANSGVSIFPLRIDGSLHTLIAHNQQGGSRSEVYRRSESSAGWEKIAQDAIEILDRRDHEIARSSVWNVRSSTGADLDIRLSLPETGEQRVAFLPERGRFSFDVPHDVSLVDFDSAREGAILVATDGGVCTYDSEGRLVGLRASLTNDDHIDRVDRVVSTERGAIAQCTNRSFLRTEGSWHPIASGEANELIRQAEAAVSDDPTAWTIVRNIQGATARAQSYQLTWQSEPVSLLADERARFAHDDVLAIEQFDGNLWIATSGGVLKLALETQPHVRPKVGKHLFVKVFPGATEGKMDVISLKNAEESGAQRLSLRTRVRGREENYELETTEAEWREARGPSPPAGGRQVVAEQAGFWTWTLDSSGKIDVALDPTVFSGVDEATDPFRNGTVGFWDLWPAAVAGGKPVAFHNRWYVGTSMGILQLSNDTTHTEHFFGRDRRGEPLANIEQVVERHGELYALRSGQTSAVFRRDQESGDWERVRIPARSFERRETLDTAWLTFSFDRPPGLSVKLRESATDDKNWRGDLLEGGRFRFDRAIDFAWHEGFYWVVTPVGVAQIGAAGTDFFLHRRGLPTPFNELRAVVDPELGLHLITPNRRGFAYRSESGWQEAPDIETVLGRHVTVADNEWTRWTQTLDGELEVHVVAAKDRLPVFRPGRDKEGPRLLQNGVFGFDDVRDAQIVSDGELLLSTRLGVWTYAVEGEKRDRLPVRNVYRANKDDAVIAMTDLGRFSACGTSQNAVAVASADRSTCFERSDGRWRARPYHSRQPARRPLYVGDTQVANLEVKGGKLLAEVSGTDFELLADARHAVDREHITSAFATPSSIWVPGEKGLLWLRRVQP